MRILLISDLPEFLEFFGQRHHYPHVPGEAGNGMTFTRIELPRTRGGLPDELPGGALAGHPGDDPVVAHLSGTTPRTARIAEGLVTRRVPFLYSPMLPSYPSWPIRTFGRLPGVRSAALGDLRLAAVIAPAARMILAPDPPSYGILRRALSMPTGRLHRVEEPGPSGPALRWIARTPVGAGKTGAFANLAVVFCDSLTPEWNVLRFLAAMEKINADAVIVAGKTEGAYAGACAERAAENPRVRFLFFDRGGIGAIAGEVGNLLSLASIVVDPSLRGLGAGAAAAAADAGVPAVVSRFSARALPAKAQAGRIPGYHLLPGGAFTFEPTSWELLNHAIICALNAAAGIQAGPESGSVGGVGDHASRNAAIAGILRGLYGETAERG